MFDKQVNATIEKSLSIEELGEQEVKIIPHQELKIEDETRDIQPELNGLIKDLKEKFIAQKN